ncbi:hypothetical protein ABTE39_19875, partial [Acinetobacter baumannii]
GTTEEDAKAKLKKALDSWVFGDTIEEFGKKNPDIKFLSVPRAVQGLSRYEILAGRPLELAPNQDANYEFVVSLVLTNKLSGQVE